MVIVSPCPLNRGDRRIEIKFTVSGGGGGGGAMSGNLLRNRLIDLQTSPRSCNSRSSFNLLTPGKFVENGKLKP